MFFLTLYFEQDRLDPDSFFQPYYSILPTSFDTMPMFWSQEELKWLKGSHMLRQIEERRRNIKVIGMAFRFYELYFHGPYLQLQLLQVT